MIRSRRQIVFEIWLVQFPLCPLYRQLHYFRVGGDPGTIQALGDIPVGLAILLVSGGNRLLPLAITPSALGQKRYFLFLKYG
jgi:hypothetical protein